MSRRPVVPTTALLAFVLAACGILFPSSTPVQTPASEYRPEVVGVVESVSFADGSVLRVVLVDGREVQLDKNEARTLQGGDPVAGDLLFYGAHPHPWFITLRSGNGRERCSLNGLATETNGELHFDFGLVLPKAADFDPGSYNFRRPGGSFFCVNERGELTRLYE